jgi:hypothetical protein
MTSHNDRPLWRVATRALTQELRRRGDAEAVQRAFLAECDTALLLAEVAVRGYRVVNPVVTLNGGEDGVAEANAPLLEKKWPPLADDDIPFDGGDRRE